MLFLGVARQQGYSAEAAQAALSFVRSRLVEGGVQTQRFYIYRTGDGGVGGGEGAPGEASGRPRQLLAFQSPDTALAFAQRSGLGASTRLIGLSLGQILAALIQRPSIAALLVADELDAPAAPGLLPPGVRVERSAVIEILAHVTP